MCEGTLGNWVRKDRAELAGRLSSDERAELATAAINTAGVIFHSDNSTPHTAKAFATAFRRLGIARSTGRTGNALDNAPAESFFSTLPHEPINRQGWAAKALQPTSPRSGGSSFVLRLITIGGHYLQLKPKCIWCTIGRGFPQIQN